MSERDSRFSYVGLLRRTFPFFIALGVLSSSYKYLDDVARDFPGTFVVRVIEEFTGASAGWLLLPAIVWWTRRVPPSLTARAVSAHFAGAGAFSIAHTTGNYLLRVAAFWLSGRGLYDYGSMPARYAMEAANDVLIYSAIAAGVVMLDRYRESRERELALTRSRLENLRLQLQPHFLFNALNAISSVMFEDPRKADAMLTRLADLLRVSLQETPSQEVTLSKELQTLELYLDIARVRFGERLRISRDFPAETLDCLVPQLILQPLVENAIRHGANQETGEIDVSLSACRQNGQLRLEVADRGPGVPTTLKRRVGLSNTIERLQSLYGEKQSFTLLNGPGGGAIAAVTLPQAVSGSRQ